MVDVEAVPVDVLSKSTSTPALFPLAFVLDVALLAALSEVTVLEALSAWTATAVLCVAVVVALSTA